MSCATEGVVAASNPGGAVDALGGHMRDSETTRAALLRAVGDELQSVGEGAMSLRGVARRAGLSHGAPGALFGSRAGMLTAFAASGYAELADRVESAALQASEPRQALAAQGAAYVGFALERPATFGLMFRADLLLPADALLNAERDRCWAALANVIAAAQRAGLVDAATADTACMGAWSIAHGPAVLTVAQHAKRRSGEPDPMAVARKVTELYADRVLRPERP